MSPSNLEILAYEVTSLGPLCLRRRELLSRPGVFITEVTLNHEFLMSSYNTDSERIIANQAADIHRGDRLKTLVGGLGLGYTAFELARIQKVHRVEVVEYLPQVIQWLEDGLVPLSEEWVSKGDAAAKLEISQGDIYERLAGPADDLYDLIVIDVDHSPDDRLGGKDDGFYTVEGISQARTHLSDGGVLAVWSYAESSPFSQALRSAFPHVEVKAVKTYNDLVDHEQTDWLFFGFG